MVKVKNKLNIKDAISHFKNGKMVIVVDNEDRENEGDFVISAEKATPDDINFMMKVGRGLICMPITSDCSKPVSYTHLRAHET